MIRLWTERSISDVIEPDLVSKMDLIGSGTDTPENPLQVVSGAQAIIAGASIDYNGQFMDKVPDLKVISRTGIGIDNITISDATDRGIAICNTPDGPTISTAEMAITLMLNTAKKVKAYHNAMCSQPQQDFISAYQGLEVNGLMLGLIGLGRIGSRVAGIAKALGMKVYAYDPFITDEHAQNLGIERASSLEWVLSRADVISLHLPLTTDTYQLMNTDRFNLMKRGAILINAARGGLVDESALIQALDTEHLMGAGLDVFDPEPPEVGNPLLQRENVITTPHLAGVTGAGKERMWRMAIENIMAVMHGIKPENIINPEVL